MPDLSDMRVMVVDDTEANIDVLIETLGGEYRVVVAMDGQSALEDIRRHPPDLILLDIMMPDMDGYEVCKRIKGMEIARDIPIIFLTALKEAGDEARGLRLGAIDYITKPFNPDLVKARVRNHLELKRHKDHLKDLVAAKSLEIIAHQKREYRLRLEKERIEAELAIASQIQHSFLPSRFPAYPHCGEFDLHAVMTPAKQVGGDFYDYFLLDDDSLALIIADVSDKSIPAALYMMVTRTIFRSLSRQIRSPAKVLEEANQLICQENETGMFITALLGFYHIKSGHLTLANAGHPPAITIETGGVPRLVSRKHGMALGVLSRAAYTEESVPMKPGESILLYTDGVTEAMSPSGELYGQARLLDLVGRNYGMDPEGLLKGIELELKTFQQGKRFDDVTMLALKRLP